MSKKYLSSFPPEPPVKKRIKVTKEQIECITIDGIWVEREGHCKGCKRIESCSAFEDRDWEVGDIIEIIGE